MAKNNTTRVRPYRPASAGSAEIPCLELSGQEVATDHETGHHLIALQHGNNMVGRADSDHICLHDDGVSRRHAKISVSSDGIVTVFDLESTNGTFVNGARVERLALREGDRVQFGPTVSLRFTYRTNQEIAAAAGADETVHDDDAPMSELPLTSRECDIAKLVADGLSNVEIGERLYISARTVGTHLTNIYKRLEIHSRTELTRLLLEKKMHQRSMK